MGTLRAIAVPVRRQRDGCSTGLQDLAEHDPEDRSAFACRVVGQEHLHGIQHAVYAANHLSALDIPVLYSSLPGRFHIMAKQELFRYPFLGWYLKRSGQIPIASGDAHASLRSLNRAGEALRKGVPLMVFPEGGRSATGQLKPFMGGAFFVAIRAQVPVVPMAIVGTYELLPINSFHMLPGEVVLAIGEPIPTAGLRLRDMEKLSAQVGRRSQSCTKRTERVPGELWHRSNPAAGKHDKLTKS